MVTQYFDNNCKYSYERLDNVVFLVNKDAIGSISIDNGAAYVVSAASATSIACSNITLSEEESLDERYQFSHSLQFTVQGYMNVNDFEGKYYVIVKDLDNTYWLLNPTFPCKITYTYTINANSNHTDFTLSTISNMPLLMVNGFSSTYSKPCVGYNLCGVKVLELNEKNYSVIDEDSVSYTNDGFKYIQYIKNTCTFTEQFDGDNVSHQVKFQINFDSYKSSWHYNLLEFVDNKYAMVMQTKCGTNIACGFNHGLQPSYVISASQDEINQIEITLSDLHDEGTFIQLPTEVPYSYLSGASWVWVEGEYECIDTTTAKRLLMEECDLLGNRLDRYKCLEGYRIDYEYLADKLIGEFTEIVTFPCDACRWNGCVLQTSMPQTITFNGQGQEKTFTLYSPSEWSITTDSGITVTPSSGTGGGDVDYITIKNNTVPTSGIQSHTIVVNYCNKTENFYADVVETSPTQCYPLGQYYNIDYNAQEVLIPTNCCVTSISANTVNLKNFQTQKGYIRMWADVNDTGTGRTMTLSVTDCTSATTEMYIYQSSFFSEWKTEQTVCNGRFMCDFQRLYSGLTQSSITAATYVTRWANCSASTECQAQNYKWVESQDTYCDNGKMYYLEYLYIYENGSWRRTSGVRYGSQAEDVSGKCTSHIERWVTVEGYYCNETTKYDKERLYYEENAGDPQSAWTETNIYRMGTTVIEYNSLDCGYGSDSGYTYQEWRPIGYECMSASLYSKERKYVSNDITNWVATDIYRIGILVEQYSTECGWVADYEYRWVVSNVNQCGSGESQYNLYQMYQQERRPIGSVSELDWEPVIPNIYSYDADGTEEPILIESGSSECNAPAPPYIPQYRWVEVDGYYCSGTTKYAKEAKQISIDSGQTWSYLSPMEYRMGDVVEYDSVECGGGSGNVPQYRWVRITPSSDPSSYICDDCDSPTASTKFQAIYNGGVIYNEACDSATTLTTATTKPSGYEYSAMTSAVIGDCVTYIGQAAFSQCSGLTSVTIPSGVTSIGGGAFSQCSSLTSIDIPNSVTYIGGGAFGYCHSLTSVTIPNSVTTINRDTFYDCRALTSVTIPTSITAIPYGTFGLCSSLTRVNSNVDGVCNIPNGVTSIEHTAFESCKSLTSVSIPSGVTYIGQAAFSQCSSLTSVTIPDSVTSIAYGAFWYCSGFTSVTIGSGVTSIGEEAFRYCTNLSSITCLAPTPPTLGSLAFNNTNNCPIYVPSGSVNAYKAASGWSSYASRIQAIP